MTATATYDWSRIEAALERAGMSKSRLARELGMHRSSLYLYRDGTSAIPERTALAIAYLLGIDVRELEASDE